MDTQLKEMLRRDKVKLWLPPYADEEFNAVKIPEELVIKYSSEKGWPLDGVRERLVHLQSSSLIRMKANIKFNETGVATLFLSCINVENVATIVDANAEQQNVEITLTEYGINLREIIGRKLNINLDHFKLIAAGRVIEDGTVLHEQGVAHLSEVLCVKLTDEEINDKKQIIWQMSVDQTRQAVSKLANQVEIADQHGEAVYLPDSEKKALSTGIALHEKGKKELKAKQVGLALLCFLEADKEFSRCRSTILHAVDNYAILCLDIVWCYLQLQSVNRLPDAENRLNEAEKGFRRSYGRNFERLAVLKQGVENEKVLIIRLQLLQGILAYYNKNYEKAFHLLTEVEESIRQLDVDAGKLVQIVQMGYTESEARFGLRAANGNLENAVQRIVADKEEAKRRKQDEMKKLRVQQVQQLLGQTKSGDWVNTKKYRDLMSMGFKKKIAAEALKESNNDFKMALDYLYAKQSSREIVSSVSSNSQKNADSKNAANAEHELALHQLSDMGFDLDQMVDISKRYRKDIGGAVNEFLKTAAPFLQQSSVELPYDYEQVKKLAGRAFTEILQVTNNREQDDASDAAWTLLEEDVPEDLNAHLDMTLEEEEQFLVIYKNLVLPHMSN